MDYRGTMINERVVGHKSSKGNPQTVKTSPKKELLECKKVEEVLWRDRKNANLVLARKLKSKRKIKKSYSLQGCVT